MKLFIPLFLSVVMVAADKPVVPTVPASAVPVVTDTQARQIRESQLAIAQAMLNKVNADKAADKTIEDAKGALQSKLAEILKELKCSDCQIDDKLVLTRPPAAKP